MPEAPELKTKRRLIDYIKNHQWTHQITFRYPDYQDTKHMVDDGKELIKWLGRLYPGQPFFWQPRAMIIPKSKELILNAPTEKNFVLMPYWICFMAIELASEEVYDSMPKKICSRIEVVTRRFTPYIRYRTIEAINHQKLYDFEKALGVKLNNYYYKNLKHFDKIRCNNASESLASAPVPQKIPRPFE